MEASQRQMYHPKRTETKTVHVMCTSATIFLISDGLDFRPKVIHGQWLMDDRPPSNNR
jgi:hypothetical protein